MIDGIDISHYFLFHIVCRYLLVIFNLHIARNFWFLCLSLSFLLQNQLLEQGHVTSTMWSHIQILAIIRTLASSLSGNGTIALISVPAALSAGTSSE